MPAADIAYKVLYFGIPVKLTHIVLFFLVPAEYPDLGNTSIQKAAEHCIPEGACAPGDEERFVVECHGEL
jgi:hypothetical protein